MTSDELREFYFQTRLITPKPETIRRYMEKGVYPYGWRGFIVGHKLFDEGTMVSNFEQAVHYVVLRNAVKSLTPR